ncbi:alpha/beta hydrolase [Pectobacterium sp. B1J-3]|uniref:alpha/beta hydrolase n=1 Tax=Pectobacterium sp. B1J-3 TaxID=3385371 RepID=UPI003905C317
MIALTLMVSSILPVQAQPSIPVISEQAQRNFDIQHFDIQSDKQYGYRLFVALPRQTASDKGYPILYMLDGNAQFPFAVNSYKEENGPAPLIVAIGYQITQAYDVPARTRDYTPPTPIRDPDFAAGGQAEDFYQFLQNQVKPWIEVRYQVDTQRQTLAGHSFGGLFTLYTLFNHSESFQRYVAASPSIWWGNGVVIPAKTPFLSTPPQSITLSVGEYENKPDNAGATQRADNAKRAQRKAQRKMVTKARELAAQLKEQGTNTEFIQFPGKNHGSVIPDAIEKAVVIAGQ